MKKVAVVNRTNLKNFGSVLQVYALCNAVEKLGYSSEVVWQSGNMSRNFDFRPNKIIRTGLKLLLHPLLLRSTCRTVRSVRSVVIDVDAAGKFDDFVAKNFNRAFYAYGEIGRIARSGKYHKFVCGSDQVWVTTTLYPDPMMYLRFAPVEKRVAYAPSLGRNYVPGYNKRTLRKWINDIPCVSVREDEGHRLVWELTGRDAAVVADPTLLMRSNEWDKLKAEMVLPGKYILCYFLDEPRPPIADAVCRFTKGKGLDIVVLGKSGWANSSSVRLHRPVAGPGEFLTVVSRAEMVITDSYHGMLFAVNYRKKFWAVQRAYTQYDQSSRQKTVLQRLGLQERYVGGNFNFTDADINYGKIQEKVDGFVAFSMDYLKNSLER